VKKEGPVIFRRLLVAIQFLTRLPIPHSRAISEEEVGKASAFFPLVGVFVGGGAAGIFVLMRHGLPLSASVLCALAFASFVTNGFHEDGLADTFDGFGGGWTKEHTLEIMRDSRIGTYGTLALIFLLFGKLNLLSSLPSGQAWRWLIVAHAASRWTTLPLCAWLPYARNEGQGKMVAGRVGVFEITFGSVTLLAAFSLLSSRAALVALFVTTLMTLSTGLYFRARLRGITGDCLGAANQLTEVALYLAAVVMFGLDQLR